MFRYLRETWKELDRSIFEGERYEKNMQGIALVAMLLVVVNIVTGLLNLINGYFYVAATSPLFILTGLIMLYFCRVRRNRRAVIITALIAFVIIFTYGVFTVTHGFTIFWTLLLPLALGYFGSVKSGIFLSAYFLTLYWIVFYTPLRSILVPHYSDIIAVRFPILYLADVFLTNYILVQYHRTTLHQMDNARQLLEAKEAADRANATKSDFLANMSHEIRTPINAVLGMNEMILRESARARRTPHANPEKAFEAISIYASDVQSAGNSLLAIINDILDFSRIEANRMEINEADYQFSSVLNDVSNMIFFKAKDKGLEFILDVDKGLPDWLYGDEVRVRQVLTNILTNAVKYTDHGSVRLEIRGEPDGEMAPGKLIRLVVTVRDTGIGIKPEDIEKLFVKFQRVDLTRNSTIEGTGLGLAITRGLLTMMGGDIRVESEYGRGSAFTVILPQMMISREPVGDFQARFESCLLAARAYEETFHAPDACILIVDDTAMNLTVAVGLLKSTEIQVDTAGSGKRAIELAGEKAYDMILMDQRMPEMDGTEAMKHIRALDRGLNRDTPVICLTADAIIGAKERYILEGFTDYLSKPIDSQALERMLMKYLPAEKLVPVTVERAVTNAPDAREPEGFEALRAIGVAPETGLGYCQNNPEIYRSLLVEYAQSAKQKALEMAALCEAQDLKNYGIMVHALKSTSRMIGALALSEIAADLERAADAGDGEAVQAGHADMLARYEQTAQAIQALYAQEDCAPEDDEIMEFMPEE